MFNLELRLAILRKYLTQTDFAIARGIHESKVSQVVRGRRKLSKEEATQWQRALDCDPDVIERVTQ